MRVLLVDDHLSIRCGLRSLLEQTDDIEVVGEARNAREALKLVKELEPDLAILDLRLQGETSGAEVCREIKGLPDAPRVLIHTAYDTAEDVTAATLAGADGYLHKGVERVGIVEVLRRVHAGERKWVVGVEPQRPQAAENANLTPKEREVLALMLQRYSNAEIGRELFISLHTVKTHVRNVMKKLGIKRRRELF